LVADELGRGQVERALAVAYRFVGKRERTTAEIARRLKRAGFGAETIEPALLALHEDGSLDDVRFARLFTEDKRDLEHWGSERIRRALIERGVDPETVEAVLRADGVDEATESDHDRALALLRRRFPEPLQTRRDRDRALGMLLRKGYESDLAVDALSAYARE
jgi:regulatory protein